MDAKMKLRDGQSIYDQHLRVCYYARVSTDHELQATSIVNQVDYFVKYIQANYHWEFVGGYVDEGISGKNVKRRENFLRMIQDGMKKKFDLVLTKSVSRFARNTVDSIRYTNLLLEYGIGVMFINDNINTIYSDSEFRLTLMASIAQDELRKLSESVQFGLKQSIERGVVLGNDNILGYVKDHGKLVIVPDEAKIVVDIFYLFLTGKYCYSEIGRIIEKKYHKKLDSTGIKRILVNCKYKGYYCGRKSIVIDYKSCKRKWIDREDWIMYRDYKNVPPIVEEGVWDQVQNIILSRNQEKLRKKHQGNSLYCGKIRCMVHGRTFSHKVKRYKNKYYSYFVCEKCYRLSEKLLDRIYRVTPFCSMEVIPGEEVIIKIKCQ